jgi:hypothetical protein
MHTIYENQKEDSIDFILELIIDSIPTVKSFPLSSRSYFFICTGVSGFNWNGQGGRGGGGGGGI